jgi:hypothetical protein
MRRRSMMYDESYYQGDRDWSFDGSEITNRRKCRCDKGEVITYTSTYSHEKVPRPNVTFSEDIQKCDICNEVDRRYKVFCKEIDSRYSEKLIELRSLLNNSHANLTTHVVDNELVIYRIKNKKHLYDLLTQSRWNSFGAIGTFYKNTSGTNEVGILRGLLNKGSDNRQLIVGLYKFTHTIVPEVVKNMVDEISELELKLNVVRKETDDHKKNKFQELRQELESNN